MSNLTTDLKKLETKIVVGTDIKTILKNELENLGYKTYEDRNGVVTGWKKSV